MSEEVCHEFGQGPIIYHVLDGGEFRPDIVQYTR